MDLRRGTGKRPYPAAQFLSLWATHADVWPYFDGWCASRNVDHEELPWWRWLNLVYYFATRNAAKEDKDKFDQAIAEHVAAWHKDKLQAAAPEVRSVQAAPASASGRKMPPRPAGWGDDRTNMLNSRAAFTSMTAPGVSGGNRRK